MTTDDIVRLAEEAGVHEGGAANWVNGNRWEQFAALVAAAEREQWEFKMKWLYEEYLTVKKHRDTLLEARLQSILEKE